MNLYIKRDRPDSSTPLFDFATTAEIMAAHPKCGECRHCTVALDGQGWCGSCMRTFFSVNPDTDYCNKWEAK